MISSLFDTFIYIPIYNSLALLVSLVPGGDVGVAIIILTILIKFILFPLSLKALRTQAAMREIDPELKSIKEKYKDNREEQARRTMELLKEKKVNPFASIFLILIQLPVIFGLFFVFRLDSLDDTGLHFDPAILYSFVNNPDPVSFVFIGLIALSSSNIILAVLVSITQFVNAQVMHMPTPSGKSGSIQHDLAKSMQVQMKYVFPIIMGFIAYFLSSALALYFLVSNLFQLFQELYVQRTGARGNTKEDTKNTSASVEKTA